MSRAQLQEWFPWTQRPVIANGPMLHAATPLLATEVTKAGGIGTYALVVEQVVLLSHG